MMNLNLMNNKERINYLEHELEIMEKLHAKKEVIDLYQQELRYEKMSSKEYEQKEIIEMKKLSR